GSRTQKRTEGHYHDHHEPTATPHLHTGRGHDLARGARGSPRLLWSRPCPVRGPLSPAAAWPASGGAPPPRGLLAGPVQPDPRPPAAGGVAPGAGGDAAPR